MAKMLIVAIAVLAVSVGLAAQGRTKSDGRSVTGTWDLVVKGPAAHGDMTATLELQQEGRQVSGTLTAHGNTHKLSGDFADGALTLEATDMPADKVLSLHGKFKDNGTLAGYLSGPMGDMQWDGKKR